MNFRNHIISCNCTVKDALVRLNELAYDAIIFITDEGDTLLGSITDGDIRRGFIRGLDFETHIIEYAQLNPKFIQQSNYDLKTIVNLRQNELISVFPVLNDERKIINIINFKHQQSYLPIDAVLMAGGKGERLRPLTDEIPKPLLPVGGKPILEHNIDRLKHFGIDDIWISLGYKGSHIQDYFQDGNNKSIRIRYIREELPLGTAGALGLVDDWTHSTILLMNSDLLTNINYEDFYLYFLQSDADLAVVSIPYGVNIPYAVLELDENRVSSLREKPTYTYYSNAGIYLLKKDIIDLIPQSIPFNATDLIEKLIHEQKKVISYPFLGYWLDIGRHEDYIKAQENINYIKF